MVFKCHEVIGKVLVALHTGNVLFYLICFIVLHCSWFCLIGFCVFGKAEKEEDEVKEERRRGEGKVEEEEYQEGGNRKKRRHVMKRGEIRKGGMRTEEGSE